jgi:hypothetical protein
MLFDGACSLAPTRPPTAMVKPPRWKLQLLRAADGIDTVRSWPQGQLHWLQQLLIDVHADATLQARTKSWETDAVLRALCDQDHADGRFFTHKVLQITMAPFITMAIDPCFTSPVRAQGW